MSEFKSGNDLVDTILKGIQEKKGKDIVVLNMNEIEHAICEYFIICHGDSNTQVNAIYNSIQHEVREGLNEKPWHKEGYENSEWILLDYSNVVVHIFQKEIRDFYRLEELWADAEIQYINDQIVQ